MVKKTLLLLSNKVQEPLNAKNNPNEFESCLSIIDRTIHHDFTIDKKYFCGNCIYKIGQEMGYTQDKLFRGQYIQMRSILIPLCLESPVRYYFNLLRIIIMLYNMYIEYEKYYSAYNTQKILYGSLFMDGKMGKWYDVVRLSEDLGDLGH